MDNNGRTMIVLIIAAILIVAGVFLYLQFANSEIEVKPNPETPPENTQNNNTDEEWSFATTTEYSIQYPADLDLEYVEMTDWPPVVEFTDDEFACVEAGEAAERAGETKSVTMGGQEYCRTISIEGAAGSTYAQYAYSFERDDGTAILTFSTRTPQCANFEDDEMADCEAEVEDLDIDKLADRIARTLLVIEIE